MVKSLAAQSISKTSPTGSADSTFTTGIRDGLHQQGVEVVLLDDFVPHRPAMDADDLALMALARLGRQRHRHCSHENEVTTPRQCSGPTDYRHRPACACGVQIPVSPYPN